MSAIRTDSLSYAFSTAYPTTHVPSMPEHTLFYCPDCGLLLARYSHWDGKHSGWVRNCYTIASQVDKLPLVPPWVREVEAVYRLGGIYAVHAMETVVDLGNRDSGTWVREGSELAAGITIQFGSR